MGSLSVGFSMNNSTSRFSEIKLSDLFSAQEVINPKAINEIMQIIGFIILFIFSKIILAFI